MKKKIRNIHSSVVSKYFVPTALCPDSRHMATPDSLPAYTFNLGTSYIHLAGTLFQTSKSAFLLHVLPDVSHKSTRFEKTLTTSSMLYLLIFKGYVNKNLSVICAPLVREVEYTRKGLAQSASRSVTDCNNTAESHAWAQVCHSSPAGKMVLSIRKPLVLFVSRFPDGRNPLP